MKGIFVRRSYAALIDLCIYLGICLVGVAVAFALNFQWEWLDGAALLAFTCGYCACTQSRRGASLGDRVAGIEVMRITGGRVAPHIAVARFCTILLLPYLLAAAAVEAHRAGWIPWLIAWRLAEGSSYATAVMMVVPLILTRGACGIHDLIFQTQVVRRGERAKEHQVVALLALSIVASLAIGVVVGRVFVTAVQTVPEVIKEQAFGYGSNESPTVLRSPSSARQISIGTDCAEMWDAVSASEFQLAFRADAAAISDLRIQNAREVAQTTLRVMARNLNSPETIGVSVPFELDVSRAFGPLTVSIRQQYIVTPDLKREHGALIICDPHRPRAVNFGINDLPLGLL